MSIKEVIELFILVGGSTGLGGLYNYYNKLKKEMNQDRIACEDANRRLQLDMSSLEHRVMISEAMTDSGFPEWKKDAQGRFIYCNGEFSRYYLSPIGKSFKDILNKKNHEIEFFSDTLKRDLDELDDIARNYPFAVKTNVIWHSKAQKAVIIKKIVTTKGSDFIYYHGISCPFNEG